MAETGRLEASAGPAPRTERQFAHRLAAPVARVADRVNFRANSLIITMFGDSVRPRGGNIWLGSLIALMRPLGLSERLVRTGVYRLSQEGWLTSRSRGRRSFYSITTDGIDRFEEASMRIYAVAPPPWEGIWRLVQILPGGDADRRQGLRRDLKWLGFGQIGPLLFAHPTAPAELIAQTLAGRGVSDETIVFRAKVEDFIGENTITAVVAAGWALAEINAEYVRFVETFAKLDVDGDAIDALSNADCFALRTLLLHDFRRILLKDPQLPASLLPSDWAGERARSLCATLYRRIAARADAHLETHMKTLDGAPPPPVEAYRARFGGLPCDTASP